jgi:DNA-binding response OmpR family regulator
VDADELRVLVVDDVADAAQSLAQLLTMSGFVAKTALDGADALALVGEFKPHCVLLDIGMPRMDGLELVQRLRSEYGDDIILVAITGRDALDARVEKTFEQVDHYLAKPVDFTQLMKILPKA